jgi:hypothetical protein
LFQQLTIFGFFFKHIRRVYRIEKQSTSAPNIVGLHSNMAKQISTERPHSQQKLVPAVQKISINSGPEILQVPAARILLGGIPKKH